MQTIVRLYDVSTKSTWKLLTTRGMATHRRSNWIEWVSLQRSEDILMWTEWTTKAHPTERKRDSLQSKISRLKNIQKISVCIGMDEL